MDVNEGRDGVGILGSMSPGFVSGNLGEVRVSGGSRLTHPRPLSLV